jgi:ZIP family zinc transporter
MQTLLIVLLSVGSSTVIGVLVGLLIRRLPHRMNDMVLGFAAGVMLAAAVTGLLAPSVENASLWEGVTAVVGTFAGAAFVGVLDRIVPHLHRIAGLDANTSSENKSAGKILLFVSAIALHKIPEGLATGVSFGTENLGEIVTVAGSISIQNIPEAIVIVAPLFAAGVKAPRVVGISFTIAAVSIVSVVCGYFLVSFFAFAQPFMLGAAGGAMLYVTGNDMIPETHSHGFEKQATFALVAGLMTVLILQRLLSGVSS